MSDTDHDMTAEAFVPADAEITEYGLEVTMQIDFCIERWVCSCGESWDGKNREDAEQHLREVTQEDTSE